MAARKGETRGEDIEISSVEVPETSPEERDQEIVDEFCKLLDRSKQLFDNLRDLPQFGQRHWQTQFGKTFDLYTKLWKFQQEHRAILDASYDLKRWQIGEIASKIGQLYYHYYLRTSDTNYLYESYQFYSAIRSRAYFGQTSKDERPEMMVKRLRYYARFIVVVLLLNEMDLVRELTQVLMIVFVSTAYPIHGVMQICLTGTDDLPHGSEYPHGYCVFSQELKRYVDTFSVDYNTNGNDDWQLVLKEALAFVEADSKIAVLGPDIRPITLRHRLTPEKLPSVPGRDTSGLRLQDVIIVGNCEKQIKFSELTLDMFRMLHVVEREPENFASYKMKMSTSGPIPQKVDGNASQRNNPHKYLLYKPTFGQLYTFLGAAFKNDREFRNKITTQSGLLENEVGPGILQSSVQQKCILREWHWYKPRATEGFYELGGVSTNKRKASGSSRRTTADVKETHCLYPEDIVPFTRKPLMLIVDSVNSSPFQSMPKIFGQPLICLLSPTLIPDSFQGQNLGGLLTLFLYNPLLAVGTISNLKDIPEDLWINCQHHLLKILSEELQMLYSSSKELGFHPFHANSSFIALMCNQLTLTDVYSFCAFPLRMCILGKAHSQYQ